MTLHCTRGNSWASPSITVLGVRGLLASVFRVKSSSLYKAFNKRSPRRPCKLGIPPLPRERVRGRLRLFRFCCSRSYCSFIHSSRSLDVFFDFCCWASCSEGGGVVHCFKRLARVGRETSKEERDAGVGVGDDSTVVSGWSSASLLVDSVPSSRMVI